MGLPLVAAPATLEAGHARGRIQAKRPAEPRVPIIGLDAGAIPGSKPGGEIGAAAYLERCGRDIVRGHLKRTRRRDHKA